MSYDGRYDDPIFINRFLRRMRITDEELAEGLNGGPTYFIPQNQSDIVERLDDLGAPLTSAVFHPRSGLRAPPPTPESSSLPKSDPEHLPSIEEERVQPQDQIFVDDSSRKSTPTQGSALEHSQPLFGFDGDVNIEQSRILGDAVHKSTGSIGEPVGVNQSHHQQQTLDLLEAETQANIPRNTFDPEAPEMAIFGVLSSSHSSSSTTRHLPIPAADVEDRNVLVTNDEGYALLTLNAGMSANTRDNPDLRDESSDDDDDDSINIIVDSPQTPDLFKTQKAATVVVTPDLQDPKNDMKDDNEAHLEGSATMKGGDGTGEESREHGVYFPTWGTPLTRASAPARVRMIVLSNLPPTTDFILVQSLIHGGAIDEMTISKTAEGPATAYILFTDADACEAYFNTYPNGLSLKHNGRNYVAFVGKGDKVNVISGNLQSYLDCGATRVVKVDGADEEWFMKALYKIAEGESGSRKVETIIDHFSNDKRTITFRFTKIVDAVAFKASLQRSPDWRDANVTFGTDPCEKATGIHYEWE